MIPSALAPRPDQIAELTRGLDLPLPAIDDIHLQIIADGVVKAFNGIRHDAPATISTGTEAEITALLVTRLNAMIETDPLWRQLVAAVVRGGESHSFDGSHLEKRPDLSIHLTARTRRFPLVVEAKIIDAARGESLYCSQGVRRFINGEYAWGGREAFMLAYVRDGSSISARLKPFLALPAHIAAYLVADAPTPIEPASCDAARSRHGRSFLYANKVPPDDKPSLISLWHLWVGAVVNVPV